MIITVEKKDVKYGVYDASHLTAEDVVIVSDEVDEITINVPIELRVLITHPNTKFIAHESVKIGKNSMGPSVFKKGISATGLNAFGDILVNGNAEFTGLNAIVEQGDLIVNGNLICEKDAIVHHGVCCVSGKLIGDGVLACDDVWVKGMTMSDKHKQSIRKIKDYI